MIRTYAELQALLADNTTGDISPSDIRDFLDSVATERAVVTEDNLSQTIAIIAQNVYQDLVIPITSVPAERFMINNNASITFDSTGGVFNVVFYLVIDAGDIPNDVAVYVQLFKNATIPFSTEGVSIKTNKSDIVVIRVDTEQPVEIGNGYTLSPKITAGDGSTGDTLIIQQLYMSVNSVPVVKE